MRSGTLSKRLPKCITLELCSRLRIVRYDIIYPEAGHFRILDANQAHLIGLGKLEVSTGGTDEAGLGYMILPEYWGQGVASKVARLLIAQAKEQPELRSLLAIIDPANLPSRRILINTGFVSREFKEFDGLPGEVLELVW